MLCIFLSQHKDTFSLNEKHWAKQNKKTKTKTGPHLIPTRSGHLTELQNSWH